MIEYSIDNNIGIIKFNSDNYNTIDNPLFTEPEKLNDFLNSGNVNAVILTGEGRHFCGGANKETLPILSSDKKKYTETIDKGKELLKLFEESPVPIVSVVKGSCFGAGLEIALSTHFIFSSKTAMFGFPEVGLGLMPGLGGTITSNRRIRKSVLTEIILSGEFLSSEEALDKGIVDYIYSGKDVFNQAVEFINRLILKRDPYQIKLILKSINNGYTMDRDMALKKESQYFAELASRQFSEK